MPTIENMVCGLWLLGMPVRPSLKSNLQEFKTKIKNLQEFKHKNFKWVKTRFADELFISFLT